MKGERGKQKTGLKLNIQNTKIIASSPMCVCVCACVCVCVNRSVMSNSLWPYGL